MWMSNYINEFVESAWFLILPPASINSTRARQRLDPMNATMI